MENQGVEAEAVLSAQKEPEEAIVLTGDLDSKEIAAGDDAASRLEGDGQSSGGQIVAIANNVTAVELDEKILKEKRNCAEKKRIRKLADSVDLIREELCVDQDVMTATKVRRMSKQALLDYSLEQLRAQRTALVTTMCGNP